MDNFKVVLKQLWENEGRKYLASGLRRVADYLDKV